ncbi:DUF5681 domain-containing protein [Microvirga sp. GCM10011540]|uniref:DUF5681 domain-containing protein n=1 Tax=Microvirga sp. GCM10011540 TaxID=3317338 RepID=UPI00361B25B9
MSRPVADNTIKKQGKAAPFQKGQSGNPAGRPKGSRNKTTLALEALLDGEAEALTRRAIEMALEGDTTAMRLCMDRIMPPRRDRPVLFAMPKLETAGDVVKATAALVGATATGELTPGEAAELSKLVEGFANAVKVEELQRRLEAMEAAVEGLK